jgi:hypothetical protein
VIAKDRNIFVGLDLSGGKAFGSSNTKDGGGTPPLFQGDGVVHNVKFGETIGIGGHIGYRVTPSWSLFLSYQHVRGDVRWDATYPSFGVSSRFDGKATSNAIMGNVAYERPLFKATSLRVRAGAGLTFNRLSSLVETDKATGQFGSNVAAHEKIGPVAEIGLGLEHKVAAHAIIGLDASIAYTGRFATGSERRGNLGTTSINPYEIDNAYRTNLGISLKYEL